MRFVNSRLNVISTAYVCTASSVELVGSVVVVLLLLHDCILRWRYSLIESLRFGVMGATGSGVVSAGFSRGSELAVLVKIFG